MPDTASYKQQKEDFVSNLSGGSVAEINYVTSVAAVCSPPTQTPNPTPAHTQPPMKSC